MGKGFHCIGPITALLLAAPAFAVGQSPISDTGSRAPKEPSWDPYAHKTQSHRDYEDPAQLRKACERHRKETCVRELKPIKRKPLRDDLTEATR